MVVTVDPEELHKLELERRTLKRKAQEIQVELRRAKKARSTMLARARTLSVSDLETVLRERAQKLLEKSEQQRAQVKKLEQPEPRQPEVEEPDPKQPKAADA